MANADDWDDWNDILNEERKLHEHFPQNWSILAGNEYKGARNDVRIVTPSKKPVKGVLSVSEKKRNKCLSHNKVLVEN